MSKQTKLSSFFVKRHNEGDSFLQATLSTSSADSSTEIIRPTSTELATENRNSSATVITFENETTPCQSTTVKTPPQPISTTNVKDSGKRGKFLPQWSTTFQWLKYDIETGVAFCSTCREQYPSEADDKWVSGCSGPFKKETFAWHAKSKSHKDAVISVGVAKNPASAPLAKCVREMEKSMFDHLKHLFHIAYFIGLHEKPFTDFPRQVGLARKLGVNLKDQYVGDKACQSFVKFIAIDLQENVVQNVKRSPFFSILIDGSTDRSGEDNADIYVRYLENGNVREDLLGLVTLESGRAQSYYNALVSLLDGTSIEWRRPGYLVSLGSDGASSMVGHKSGLITLLQKDVPNCLSTHCVAHRLQLAVLDASKEIDDLKDFDKIIKNVFHFYRGSNKRLQGLRKTAIVLEQEVVKLQDIHSVRWLVSKKEAMTALKRNFVPLIINLEEIASNTSTDGSANAKGIVLKLKNYKFAKMLHFLIDLYGELEPLCKILQKKELLLSQIKTKIEVTVQILETYLANEGTHVKQFVAKLVPNGSDVEFDGLVLTRVKSGEKQYQQLRTKMIINTCHYLRERLDSTKNIVGENCHVLDPLQHPDQEELASYGNSEIVQLGRHFRVITDDTEPELVSDWMEFKYSTRGVNIQMQGYLKKLELHPDRYTCLRKVIQAVACVAVSTSSCERGFSFINRIKSKQRLSLNSSTLGDLLQISVNGPPEDEYDPKNAIDKWYFDSSGKRHVDGHKRKLAEVDSN